MGTKAKHYSELTEEEAENRAKEICQGCGFLKPDVEERYSFTVYAGRRCRECAIGGFRDACGLLDGRQGDPADLEEPLEED